MRPDAIANAIAHAIAKRWHRISNVRVRLSASVSGSSLGFSIAINPLRQQRSVTRWLSLGTAGAGE